MPELDRRPVLERRMSQRGVKFYHEGGELMFVHQLDSSSRVGPRPATREDSEMHAQAWALFVEELEGEGADDPFTPTITATDPAGGPPPKEVGHHASARAAAKAEGRG